MKMIAKMVVLSLVLSSVVMGGCAKKCAEPVMQHKLHKMKHEAGGK